MCLINLVCCLTLPQLDLEMCFWSFILIWLEFKMYQTLSGTMYMGRKLKYFLLKLAIWICLCNGISTCKIINVLNKQQRKNLPTVSTLSYIIYDIWENTVLKNVVSTWIFFNQLGAQTVT